MSGAHAALSHPPAVRTAHREICFGFLSPKGNITRVDSPVLEVCVFFPLKSWMLVFFWIMLASFLKFLASKSSIFSLQAFGAPPVRAPHGLPGPLPMQSGSLGSPLAAVLPSFDI